MDTVMFHFAMVGMIATAWPLASLIAYILRHELEKLELLANRIAVACGDPPENLLSEEMEGIDEWILTDTAPRWLVLGPIFLLIVLIKLFLTSVGGLCVCIAVKPATRALARWKR